MKMTKPKIINRINLVIAPGRLRIEEIMIRKVIPNEGNMTAISI